MPDLVLGAFAGLILGAGLAVLFFRIRERARHAVLEERLSQLTSRLQESEQRLHQREHELGTLRDGIALDRARIGTLEAELNAALHRARDLDKRLFDTDVALREAQSEGTRIASRLADALARGETLAEQGAYTKAQLERLQQECTHLNAQYVQLQTAHAEVMTLRDQDALRLAEQRALLDDARTQLADTFKALSADALRQSNTQFLELAKETLSQHTEVAKGELTKREEAVGAMVQPLREALSRVETYVQQVEKDRTDAYAGLREQVSHLHQSHLHLRQETAQLVTALRAPQVRGRWGEVQLRRVVELAGMMNYCDFHEQVSSSRDGATLRPDMIVRLPSKRTIVVDSKVSLDAYLTAHELTEESAREAALKRHAAQVRTHVSQLSQKAYTQGMEESPEFVVLFLPGEPFFSAALQYDPSLIEFGVDRGVILATPTTLIALLKAVHYGWRQETLAENARLIQSLGEDLYKRTGTLAKLISKTGTHLGQAVSAYNDTVGSFQSRFVVQIDRFRELGAGLADPLPQVEVVDKAVRSLDRSSRDDQPNA